MTDLSELAADLEHAAHIGGVEAGAGAVRVGSWMAESGLRAPGKAAQLATSGLGELTARIGATQRRGVYQERAPRGLLDVDTGAVAGRMAEVAAELGVRQVAR